MKYSRNVYRALAMISQFGINMLVPIFMCSFIGILLDKKLGTSYWVIILFLVGAMAGFRNVFIFAKRIYETPAQTRVHHKKEAHRQETADRTLWQNSEGDKVE